jgi:hypothetical protein
VEKLSDGQGEGSNAPSYYDEGSEYDEEYESEEDEVGGETDLEGRAGASQPDDGLKKTKKKDKQKKEFDPRTDKLLDIASNEDYLMDSL